MSSPLLDPATTTATINTGVALANKIGRARKAAACVGPVAIKLSVDGREATVTGSVDAVHLALGSLHTASQRRGHQTLPKSSTPGNSIALIPKYLPNSLNPAEGITLAPMLVRGHDPEAGRRWKAWATKTLMHF
eukprot:TRINITY_DN8834_c0_g1_i1.p1 TRINITY_DN8834_c0_g1~~TRINITY_DN8834_c0_g1_i1.p1  ORF type:complete len:134 (-),score=33.06 TRINITY_DN8834_c0_g1_i1:199-600(-)